MQNFYEREEEYFIMQPDILCHHLLVTDKQENIVKLKIFSITESLFLRKAVMEYQVLHPDLKITYDFMTHNAPENSQETELLLKRMKAEIISGRSADIYVLNLPWESYSQMNEHLEGTCSIPMFFRIDYLNQFSPGMLIGVHCQTQYPEKACDFLQFLISYTDTYM